MSGGSLEYLFHRIDDLASMIEERAERPLHKAFADHLRKVSTAAHDLEWEWSSDYGEGDADKSIKEVVSKQEVSERILKDLDVAIINAENFKKDLNA
jgi:hypothetical protein